MPQIVPIRDLKNTADISNLCRTAGEPVFITKNGYGDMVIMSIEIFEKNMFMQDLYRKLDAGERSIENGRTMDAFESLKLVREKHGL
ncbi:MAG: type II toxin-antitoxin system Phd/YefM family antitoxin [Oscillospiraceae bacterium]|nr:type II toxin-antitoxin system Phd/YefM family antitoxin [Oscillospiraceae bacterium]